MEKEGSKSLSQRQLALSKKQWPLQRGASRQRHWGWNQGMCQCYHTHHSQQKCLRSTADRDGRAQTQKLQTQLLPSKSTKWGHPHMWGFRDKKKLQDEGEEAVAALRQDICRISRQTVFSYSWDQGFGGVCIKASTHR